MKISVDTHFKNKLPVLRKIYDKLEHAVCDFGEVSVEPIKGGIFFKKAGTFAMIAFRKDHLKVEFFLKQKYDAFPVEKTFQYTQKKIVHVVPVSSVKEVDKQLVKWLRESWELAK
ncbi:MAG: hypothetical protein HY064_02435 [Bacteroidetes bacterium]|nr:hypothetical protein [Bacteroidota bacterium]